ncbi:hypothetical protein AAG570_002522 [Ranatra chinensis]|uniref:Uncharacterized protein n=1 Tax=Ranatra chinensis TaxID=642074 RepID=A0ABD0YLX6_9HEMI
MADETSRLDSVQRSTTIDIPTRYQCIKNGGKSCKNGNISRTNTVVFLCLLLHNLNTFKTRYTRFSVCYRFECFCSNDRPSYKARAEENECNSNCDGNQAEICGGGLRLSVYELQGAVENPVESQYVGCFVDNQSRVLRGGRKDTDILTPDLCVGYCYQQGFRLAGVQYGKECHCGDALVQRTEVNGQECSTPCAGDGRLQCGGTWRVSVYHTGIPDLPHENNYLGCFQDNATGVRLLSAVKHVFKNNDVRLCMNVCFSQGYKYAGAEYGVECFCGNRKPAANVEVEENQCSMRCPKDKNSFCGGAWKISVYSTAKPSLRPTPQNPVRSNATNLSSEPVRATTPRCEKSVTQVNGKNMCKGQLIFREEFNRPLDDNKWTRENKMPWSPDYEFVVFTENEQNLYIKNNLLHIKPTLLNESFVRNGKLQLTSCTGQRTEECSRQGMSYFILPPIESGRITTKESFSFKYGIINLRAKMPVGDWLRPELWLEPKRNAYGPGYSSGRVQLAMARGNINLSFGDYILGNNLLEAGVMIGTNDEIRGRAIEWNNPNGWHDDFHNYTLIWTPGK